MSIMLKYTAHRSPVQRRNVIGQFDEADDESSLCRCQFEISTAHSAVAKFCLQPRQRQLAFTFRQMNRIINHQCPRCSKTVYFAEEIVAIGQHWHRACFRCANPQCQKRLDSLNCADHDGEAYCTYCYKKLFGPKGYGYGQGAGVLSMECANNGESQLSNVSSFAQAQVAPLLERSSATNRQDSASIFNKSTRHSMGSIEQPICRRCSRAAYIAERVVSAGGVWHKVCLTCAECNKILESAVACENNGEVYCKTCYGRKFGPKGYGYGVGAGTLQTPRRKQMNNERILIVHFTVRRKQICLEHSGSYAEGFGNEVVIALGFWLFVLLIILAWLSTSVPQDTRTYVVVQYENNDASAVVQKNFLIHTAPLKFCMIVKTSSSVVPDEMRIVELSDEHTLAEPPSLVSNSSDEEQQPVVNDGATSDPIPGNEQPVNESPKPPLASTENAANAKPLNSSAGDKPCLAYVKPPVESASENADTAKSTLKLRFLDESHRLVVTLLSQSVGDFKRQNFESDINEGKIIRLIYRGQLLRDDSRSLASYGLSDNCVVHCHISQAPYSTTSGSGSSTGTAAGQPFEEANRFDVGNWILPIFGVEFAMVGYALYNYPQYFDTTSIISLILCTIIFLMFCVGSTNRRNSGAENENSRTDAVNQRVTSTST
ncbi:cysteine and glycine-rich protein 1 [Trichinella spiralis]|uniref:cysteine and glycine-rich protein 1 n=1 Tax=Trichinella spiralis TaxID=6334 RepID=UPI0001EFBE7A|nr:cysteine and glycine-rich protein 1 [Trichinella spiralis]